MTEKELDAGVRAIIRDLRVKGYHTFDSRRSAEGFPDWVVAGPGGVLFRELKTDTGKLTPAQVAWGETLLAAGADWAVWRPADLLRGDVARQLAAVSGMKVKSGVLPSDREDHLREPRSGEVSDEGPERPPQAPGPQPV